MQEGHLPYDDQKKGPYCISLTGHIPYLIVKLGNNPVKLAYRHRVALSMNFMDSKIEKEWP